MSKTRLYLESPIASERQLIVSGERARYISRVLRLKINDKLVNLDFSSNFKINSYKYLDELSNSKKLDYSIDLS